jgi:predicted SAM-dependent methyltransferase
MKLHLGCGCIYLEGYVNIDADLPHHRLAKFEPELVKKNITTVENYYKQQVTREDIESKRLHEKPVVVDVYCNDFLKLPWKAGTIDEIRLVQVFEHFTYEQGRKLVEYWYTLLKPGGVLHLDIPDLYETAKQYTQSITLEDKKWYTRLLFGSQKNEYGLHRSMYDMPMISALLNDVGFRLIFRLDNIHFYPAFAVQATK